LRKKPVTIELGEKTFEIRPLTLRQVQEIEPLLLSVSDSNIATALKIVEVALRRNSPEDAAGILDVEATAPEIAKAMAEILKLGGFIEGGPEKGEEEPLMGAK
jgi:hypothetical protein